MNGFILFFILFCGANGFKGASFGSVSNASQFASDAIHTAHEIIEIQKREGEYGGVKDGEILSGGKRTRRGSEITLESVSNASRSASDAVHTAHELVEIKKEFDNIRGSKGDKKPSGGKRTRRGSEITLESVSNASRSASDAVHTAHELVEIKKEFDNIRGSKGDKKPSGGKRTRRGSEITLESVSNASKSASDAVHTAHKIVEIKKEFDNIRGSKGDKKPSGAKRTRRGSEITPESLAAASKSASEAVRTAQEIVDIKKEFDEIRKGSGKRTRRGSEITLESVSDASKSASEAVHTAHELLDIKKEFDTIRKGGKGTGSIRTRRGSITESATADAGPIVNKVTAGFAALLKTYVYQPLAHGNFQESTIRGYTMFEKNEGKFVFGTLDGELNQSFRSIMKDRNPRTGDIISCRIPTSKYAEHYMMVVNKKIAEVFVAGGKETSNGIIGFDSYLKSSYINSTECLHHQNRLISRAEQIDEKNGNSAESDLRYQDIYARLECTINSKTPGKFVYDIWSCNCQDLVLYWAYGYAENQCAEKIGCIQKSNTLYQIAAYVDEKNELKQPEDYSSSIVIGK